VRFFLLLAIAGVATSGCELRGEKQDKRMRGDKASKAKVTTTQTKTTKKVEPPKRPPTVKRPPVKRPPPRKLGAVKPGDIKWEPYTVKAAGLTFDSFGKATVRELAKNSFVATSQAPLNAFIFYSGKHTYEKESKRYDGRPKIKVSKETTVKICGKPGKRREVNTGALTAVLTGFKHKNIDMLAVWRVPTNLRKQYAAAEARFLKSIKCK